jgi:hypothetical protein
VPDGAETVRVEVPGIDTLLGFKFAVSGAYPCNTSPTFPVKPRIPVTLTVDVQDDPPAIIAMNEGSAEISKSGCTTSTTTEVEPVTVPMVAVAVMSMTYVWAFVPVRALTVRTVDPGTVTVEVLNVGFRGDKGEATSDTWPVKPPDPVIVIVELFDKPPATKVRKYRLGVRSMDAPVTVIRISAWWNRRPPLEKKDASTEME